jgi:hypothetical protein
MCIICLAGLLIAFVVGLILLCRRRARTIGAVLLFISIGTSGYAIWQANRYERNFPNVQIGDSKQRVRGLLGRPWSVTDGTKAEYGLPRVASEIRPDVTEEFWYYCMYAPGVWSVSFDREHKVIGKKHLISP